MTQNTLLFGTIQTPNTIIISGLQMFDWSSEVKNQRYFCENAFTSTKTNHC